MLSRLALCFLTLTLAGCTPSTPATAQRLVGSWSRVEPEGTFTLTFAADGRVRAQFESRAWILQLSGADFDVTGQWSLDGQTLTLRMDADQRRPWIWEQSVAQEPPPIPAGIVIHSLTATELILATAGDPDPDHRGHYHRVTGRPLR